MNVVHDEVLALVQKEHDAAAEKYGPIASLHEGYAVLLEEVDELSEACNEIKRRMQIIWHDLRNNDNKDFMYIDNLIKSSAVLAACEAIQVAAVCQRILDREDKFGFPWPIKEDSHEK